LNELVLRTPDVPRCAALIDLVEVDHGDQSCLDYDKAMCVASYTSNYYAKLTDVIEVQ
jgi:hypothetical protein